MRGLCYHWELSYDHGQTKNKSATSCPVVIWSLTQQGGGLVLMAALMLLDVAHQDEVGLAPDQCQ